ncbi:MAG: TonB-dependent receptor [Bacteroidia bacterium]|nr:TonB-dependent receptor [Bacteroidia bacterium]
MKLTYRPFLLIILLSSFLSLYAQTTIKGRIMDAETKETIIGAWVMVEDSGSGTISDYEGRFEFKTAQNPPIKMKISFLGYRSSNFIYYGGLGEMQIFLVPDWGGNIDDIVISASKVQERNLEAPVTIQKLGILDLAYAPTDDFYAYLHQLKGAQVNTSGRTFQSINTRGFAGVQNWRFLQLRDGMDLAIPGFGFAFSMMSGYSELDLKSIEIVPGTGSPLYGPNAFNGLMHLRTKSPFDYEGVSFFVNSGASQQIAGGSHPYLNAGIRVAKKLNEKWAFKVNASYLDAVDWTADDQSSLTNSVEEVIEQESNPQSRRQANFNRVNTYGDDILVNVDLLGTGDLTEITRSGIAEKDILDYNTEVLQLSGAIHYRPNATLELIYDAYFTEGDATLRQASLYPLVNMSVFSHKLEARGSFFQARIYYSEVDGGESYSTLQTGAFIQEGLKPLNIWARDYQMAFSGQIPGVAGGLHDSARAFADWGMASPESEEFQELRKVTLESPDILFLGSKLINQSNLFHAEGNYDLSKQVNGWQLLVGASARRYQLYSAGSLFNDGVLGFWSPIPIFEFGSFIQAGVDLADEHIQLKGILRYDKNQNFQGRISPRASAVFSLGGTKNHNIRISVQSGFRNPSAQESFARIRVPQGTILGGVESNIENYSEFDSGGRLIKGNEIWGNLLSLPSYQNYLNNGNDPGLLEAQELDFLRQEQIFSMELGYKALLNDQLFLDFNVYRSIYNQLVSQVSVYSLQLDQVLSVYSNIDEPISSVGGSAGFSFKTQDGFKIGSNYTFASYNADEAVANNPGFLPAFNMPRHQANAQVQHLNLYKGLGFGLAYHWSDAYFWESEFGVGRIDAFQTWDASLHYDIPESPFRIKVGATNLLNREYRTVYGGPFIGRQYFLKVVFE